MPVMPQSFDKKDLEHLAELARMELHADEEEKLLADITNILKHFEVIQSLPTDNVQPMAGGTELTNALRADGERENTNRGAGVEAFPEKTSEGFLKVPPVFE